MTTHESFKKRVRERMTRTGEKYGAARRALLAGHDTAHDGPAAPAGWVSAPEASDERIRENTGRGWDAWVAAIDAGPGREAGHTAIAAWVRARHPEVSGWWAQSVAVGYERITGLRVPGQRADGTFSVGRSRVLDLERDAFRALLLDDADRADLVPGLQLTLRSRPGTKVPRFAVADDDGPRGILLVATDPAGNRLRVTATHEQIGSAAEAEHWKAFWAEWLEALAKS